MPKAAAEELDRQDPLGQYRSRFLGLDKGGAYLDGNSLGPPLKASIEKAQQVLLEEWQGKLVGGWHDWLGLPSRLGDKIGDLLGASTGSVIACDSTSVNLYKLVCAAASLRGAGTVIVADNMQFPSDVYVLQGIAADLGLELRIVDTEGLEEPEKAIEDAVTPDVFLVVLSHVAFKTGALYPMIETTRMVQTRGAMMLWDLSHSAGAVPVQLIASGAEFAVGCTYKYLNGGPGAPAYLYVNSAILQKISSPIQGWFGADKLFEFGLDYQPGPGILRFLAGTPSIISMAAVEPGVDLLLEVGMKALREKSIKMGEFLISAYDEHLAQLGFVLQSPRDAESRGSHVSFGHPQALGVDLALIHEHNVVPDFRAPDTIRFGFAPLYNSFADLATAVEAMVDVVSTKKHLKYESEKPAVT